MRSSLAAAVAISALCGPLCGQVAVNSSPANSLVWEYDDGLICRSANGDFLIGLEGLFQTSLILAADHRDPSHEFFVRRMRPELFGRFQKDLLFRFEPKFTESEVELEEAWVGADLGSARLMIGRMKAPFGLEEVRSRRHIDFPRFSILNQFSPAEDHGVFLNGTLAEGEFEYGLAFYNGTGGANTGSSRDFAGRWMWHPMRHDEASIWHNLQLGAAVTYGEQRNSVGGKTITNAAGLSFMEYADGTQLDGERLRGGLELAWFSGPWMITAEGLTVRQRMSRGGQFAKIDLAGAYVDIACVLTGEDKSFAGIHPDNPAKLSHLSGGAWSLALRLADLRSDRALRDLGLVTTSGFARTVRSFSVGLNWTLNDHAIIRHAYVHSFYSDPINSTGPRTHQQEGAFMIEWQLHF